MNRRRFLQILAGTAAASTTAYFLPPIGGWKSDVIAHAFPKCPPRCIAHLHLWQVEEMMVRQRAYFNAKIEEANLQYTVFDGKVGAWQPGPDKYFFGVATSPKGAKLRGGIFAPDYKRLIRA